MIRFLNISYWLLISSIALLTSCAAVNKEETAIGTISEKIDASNEVDQQFSAEQLERGNLIAFEVRAKEKLVDFFNYLSIISDPEYDTAFKKHAMNLALALFVNNEAYLPVSTETDEQEMTVEELLKKHLSGEYGRRQYEVEEMDILSELQKLDINQYSGKLSFKVSAKENEKEVFNSSGQISMNAVKIEKYFGQDKRNVWEVFLGDLMSK